MTEKTSAENVSRASRTEEKVAITYSDHTTNLDSYIDKEAERRLVWKLDLWLLPILTLAYLSCFIDRASIGNARVLGLATELGLVGYQVPPLFPRTGLIQVQYRFDGFLHSICGC